MENLQVEAFRAAAGARERLAAVFEKVRSGDLRGALARVGFALADLGELLGHLTAAQASANQAGYLPPLPEGHPAALEGAAADRAGGGRRSLWCVLIHNELCSEAPECCDGVQVFEGGSAGVLVTAPTREQLRDALQPYYEHPDAGGCLDDLMSAAFEAELPDPWVGGSSPTYLFPGAEKRSVRAWFDVTLGCSGARSSAARQAAAEALGRERTRLEKACDGRLDEVVGGREFVGLVAALLDDAQVDSLRAAVREVLES